MPTIEESPTFVSRLGQWEAQNAAFSWHTPSLRSWVGENLPASLPGLVYAKIGPTALQRLEDFRRWPAGWNNGSGDEIAWGTLQNLDNFLSLARFRTSNPPSLFLTTAGHIELVWEAKDGTEVNVSFTPAGATYFFAQNGEEGDVPSRQLGDLVARTVEMTI